MTDAISEPRNSYFREVQGVQVVFSKNHNYVDTEGKERLSTGGCKFTNSRGETCRLTAMQLATIFQLVAVDLDVKTVLKEQLETERQAITGLTFG